MEAMKESYKNLYYLFWEYNKYTLNPIESDYLLKLVS